MIVTLQNSVHTINISCVVSTLINRFLWHSPKQWRANISERGPHH